MPPSNTDRPPMHQTHTPFVEFYMGGVDVLRSPDGRPRELISFTHAISMRGQGSWVIEVFDPAYTALEELIFDLNANDSTRNEGTGPGEVAAPVMFKYGYVSRDGNVLSTPPTGEEYYVGSISKFTPDYQPHGTHYTVEGLSIYRGNWNYAVDKRTFYSTSIYDIVKQVCDFQGWKFIPLLEPEGTKELPEDKRPEVILDTGQAVESTEEQPRSFKMRSGEGPFEFIKRLCGYARSQGTQYQGFTCRLEYRADGQENDTGVVPTKTQGYLYFGPMDPLVNPVRKYVYMRDPHSDILSFAPNIMADIAVTSGSAGVHTRNEDARHGEMAFHSYSEVDRKVKYFGGRRPKSGMTMAELGVFQEGEAEEETEEEAIEGATTGPQQIAPLKKDEPDSPSVEHVLPINNRYFADREYMHVWLQSQMFVSQATLQVFGDPYIFPPQTVAVYIFVPVENDEFRIHWTSSIWIVNGVVHNISSGTFTTSLTMLRNGSNGKGGVATKALYKTLVDTMDEDALDRLGA